MKVVIDPAIEKNAELRDRVSRANTYLEPQLGRFKGDVEARWTTPADRQGCLGLTLRFTDEFPVEASDTFSAEVLRPGRYASLWLRGVVDALLGRRVDIQLSRLRQMLAQLEEDDTSGELVHAQAHVNRTGPAGGTVDRDP